MYVNVKYGDQEALMNFVEIDGVITLLCNKLSDKVQWIKEHNNEAILVKDGTESAVSVEWVEDSAKVQEIWDTFESKNANYFRNADDLFGMKLTIK